jgi:hypothetical protein
MDPGGTVSDGSKVAELAVTTTSPATLATPVMAVAESGLTANRQPRANDPRTVLIA